MITGSTSFSTQLMPGFDARVLILAIAARRKLHAGLVSEVGADLRLLRWESIEEPKIDLAQEQTSIKRVDFIASFTRSLVTFIVDKGMSKILVPRSFSGLLAAKILYLPNNALIPHSAGSIVYLRNVGWNLTWAVIKKVRILPRNGCL